MSSLNQVTLIGRLGADPESKSFQNGGKVVNLRLATSESWKDKNTGERKERTEWHTVCVFNEGIANVAERYLRKGSQCLVQGKLQTRKWQDQQGNDRYATEVVLNGFDAKLVLLGDGGNARGSTAQESSHSGAGKGNQSAFADDLDDDVPF